MRDNSDVRDERTQHSRAVGRSATGGEMQNGWDNAPDEEAAGLSTSPLLVFRRDDEPDVARTLVILEMIFCDAESDEEVLATYFDRFRIALASVLQQEMPADAELQVTLHFSRDKQKWIERTEDLLKGASSSNKVRVQLHIYDHPENGYAGGDSKRIDWVKGPNKHSPYRERLFIDAHDRLDISRYPRVIRVNLDDDDVWLPWHVQNMCAAARSAMVAPEVRHDVPLALGLLDVVVGYVSDDGVDADVVRLRRTLTGEKFYVLEGLRTVEEIAAYSSLGIPEKVDVENHERLERHGVALYAVLGLPPSLIYFRWGQNLSLQDKGNLELMKFGEHRLSSPAAALDLVGGDLPGGDEVVRFAILGGGALQLVVHRSASGLAVASNLEEFPMNAQICYYLIHDKERVDAKWYSRDGATFFAGAPAGSSVRGFLRVGKDIIDRTESRIA